jgi:hypothetical protein
VGFWIVGLMGWPGRAVTSVWSSKKNSTPTKQIRRFRLGCFLFGLIWTQHSGTTHAKSPAIGRTHSRPALKQNHQVDSDHFLLDSTHPFLLRKPTALLSPSRYLATVPLVLWLSSSSPRLSFTRDQILERRERERGQ